MGHPATMLVGDTTEIKWEHNNAHRAAGPHHQTRGVHRMVSLGRAGDRSGGQAVGVGATQLHCGEGYKRERGRGRENWDQIKILEAFSLIRGFQTGFALESNLFGTGEATVSKKGLLWYLLTPLMAPAAPITVCCRMFTSSHCE